MRDFPIFTTENGVASLVLREIPYRQRAYIRLLDSMEPEKLLHECCSFCVAVGAEKIYASGHAVLEAYPLHARIRRMESACANLPQTTACAVPVTKETLEQWKRIYNEKMADVPNASYMDDGGAKDMLCSGSGYYIHRDGKLIGIGKAAEATIEALASLQPGAGEDILCALAKVLTADVIELQVAFENTRAVALYERLGFVFTEEVSRWYQIL